MPIGLRASAEDTLMPRSANTLMKAATGAQEPKSMAVPAQSRTTRRMEEESAGMGGTPTEEEDEISKNPANSVAPGVVLGIVVSSGKRCEPRIRRVSDRAGSVRPGHPFQANPCSETFSRWFLGYPARTECDYINGDCVMSLVNKT